MVFGPREPSFSSVNTYPIGVHVLDPANNNATFKPFEFDTVWFLGVPQGVGDSGGSTNAPVSAVPDYFWKTEDRWGLPGLTLSSVTLNLDATGLVTLEQFTGSTPPPPHSTPSHSKALHFQHANTWGCDRVHFLHIATMLELGHNLGPPGKHPDNQCTRRRMGRSIEAECFRAAGDEWSAPPGSAAG